MIPRITITMISSINVKPFCDVVFFMIFPFLSLLLINNKIYWNSTAVPPVPRSERFHNVPVTSSSVPVLIPLL